MVQKATPEMLARIKMKIKSCRDMVRLIKSNRKYLHFHSLLTFFSSIPGTQVITLPERVQGCGSCRKKEVAADQRDQEGRSPPLRRAVCRETL